MGIFREIPPTAGFPLGIRDIISAFTAGDSGRNLEADFMEYLDVSYARATYSGTAALFLILESLKGLSGKKNVVIPSFVCPLVALAVIRAGLKVEICDINRDNFSYDADMLETICRNNGDILAIVAVHLAGLPIEMDAISGIAQRHGIFIIEDCAQAFGALYKGMKVGTIGDISFFSLCRGKGITTYEGGMITTGGDEYARLLDECIGRLVDRNYFSEAFMILMLLGYGIFYRPLLFWPVFRLPQFFWNWRGDRIKAAAEEFDLQFPVHDMSEFRRRIGHSQFNRADTGIAEQRRKARLYLEAIRGIEGITPVTETKDSTATYPFVTLIIEDPRKREEALDALERSGYGGSFVYAYAVADYGYLRNAVPAGNCANARHIAARTVTLSTSCFLDDGDIPAVAELLRGRLQS